MLKSNSSFYEISSVAEAEVLLLRFVLTVTAFAAQAIAAMRLLVFLMLIICVFVVCF